MDRLNLSQKNCCRVKKNKRSCSNASPLYGPMHRYSKMLTSCNGKDQRQPLRNFLLSLVIKKYLREQMPLQKLYVHCNKSFHCIASTLAAPAYFACCGEA